MADRIVRPTGYRLTSYGEMITDGPRMAAYARALQGAVQPGAVVLDIGAGTGIYSLLACRFGAAEVHAVEPHDAILVARKSAAANGFAARIQFHQAVSTAVDLPRRADVVVSDLRGVLPLFQKHIPAIVDARRRLLAPGGELIPRRDRLYAALMEDAEVYRGYVEPWQENSFGLDLTAAQPFVVNSWRKVSAKPEQLLTIPQLWATLDYRTIEQPGISGELTWTAERAGTAHGLLLWFNAELAEGVGFSNAPGEPPLIYGQAFFPLQAPVALTAGDVVQVCLRADLVDDDYVWGWTTRVTAPTANGPLVKASFRQSTAYSAPISLAKLKQRERGFVPRRSDAVEIDQLVLTLIDGRQTLGDIAAALMARFPQRFPRQQDALTHAADVAQRYA